MGQPDTIESRLADAEETIVGLMDIVAGKKSAAPDAAAKNAAQIHKQKPSIWCWRYLNNKQIAQQWGGLENWVAWLSDRYPKTLRDLPPCWYLHTEAVEELTALWAAWKAAYYGDDNPRDAMIFWHDRWLPGVVRRLLAPGGILTGCATAKKHRDVNLDGAPRNNFAPIASNNLQVSAAG